MIMTSPGAEGECSFLGPARALILVDGLTKTAAPRFAVSKGWIWECRSDLPSPHFGLRAAFPACRR
jgi:hypothetical protein